MIFDFEDDDDDEDWFDEEPEDDFMSNILEDVAQLQTLSEGHKQDQAVLPDEGPWVLAQELTACGLGPWPTKRSQ